MNYSISLKVKTNHIKDRSFKYESIYSKIVRTPLLAIKNDKFDIDLCINNVLGAINTKLIL